MKQIQYTGSSKLISRIVHLLNRKAPLPLDGQGNNDWGTNGQVLTTDGQGNTSWTTPQGGGGDVTDVEVNGTSVVNAQGVAEVTVPTNTSDLNNDSGFIDSTDLSTALADYTPTANLASVATSGQYSDLSGTPSLATVATSGDYDDLTNKPSIPTVGDGTITIQKNGSTVDTFTTNQSANKTVNITVTEGHTIWNRIKTALTARGKLWFADASVSDVSADDATKVEVVTELASETAFDNLATDGTEDGVYCFPDSGEEYLTADNVGYGSGTVKDALDGIDIPNVAYKNVNNRFSVSQNIDNESGTTSTIGATNLIIGNNKAAGTDKNARGQLLLYGNGSYYALLRASNASATREIELPDKSGTVALTNDLAPSSGTLIQSISVNGSATYTPTSSGFISLVCSSGTANQTINAIMRDANLTSYGVSIHATVVAYSDEPIGYLHVKSGRTYSIRNLSTSTKAVSFYFCN